MGGSIIPCRINVTGARVALLLTPKARQRCFRSIPSDPAGDSYFKAGVSAPAKGNKTNKAFTKLLACELGPRANAIRVASGGQARQKLTQIAGNPVQIKKRLKFFRGDLS